jgi:NADPH:quinone reductase-like Zn-dependent oxidoreductase
VRLTAYGGSSADLPAGVLQHYLDRLAAGEVSLGPSRVYGLDQVREAHTDMEQNRPFGKLVVTLAD